METRLSWSPSTPLFPDTTLALSVQTTIISNNLCIKVYNTLIDSGASACFINQEIAARYKIPKAKRSKRSTVRMIDGSTVSSGAVTEVTEPLLLKIGGHSEWVVLNFILSPSYPVILGMPWLRRHNPAINWKDQAIRFTIGCNNNKLSAASITPFSLPNASATISPGNSTYLPNAEDNDKGVSISNKSPSEIFLSECDTANDPNVVPSLQQEPRKNYPRGQGYRDAVLNEGSL